MSLVEAAPRKLHYRFAVTLDGTEIPGKALPKRSGQKEEGGLRPFKFASVRLTGLSLLFSQCA